ncbi:hypothetical protein ACLOJK_010950 [Asimina triloba]
MEGIESESVFDSLNLNPQLFVNEVLNAADDLVDGAFDFYKQQASGLMGKMGGGDRSAALNQHDSSSDSLLPEDILTDAEIDAQLDKLREQLVKFGRESAELHRELHVLEKECENADRKLIWLLCTCKLMKWKCMIASTCENVKI